jgi:Na+/H+ antiporter NhaA
MSALVGIGVTISIIWAGIQYASSADDPQKVAAAKRRILVAVMVLLGYFLLYRFLAWVIPGGIG